MLASGLGPEFETQILVARQRGFGSSDMVDGVPVCRLGSFGTVWSLPLAPTYPFMMARKLKDVDLVAIHVPFPLADLGLRIYAPRNKAVVVHWHSEIVAQRRITTVLDHFINHTLDRADKIVASSDVLVKESPYLRERSEKCQIIPFGIDIPFWEAVPRNDLTEVGRIKELCPNLVVSVGRLVDYKGFDVLVDAVSKIDCQLIIFGSGKNYEMLQKKIRSLGMAERINVIQKQSREEIRKYLHAAKIFVLPSVEVSETFGIVQLEAMAAGLPVVNTALATAVPTVARHGLEALTVPANDAQALGQAIEQLLGDDALRTRLGLAARSRVRTTYDMVEFKAGIAQIYREAVEQCRC
jgi:rhamnosyl/mannosyltransferase